MKNIDTFADFESAIKKIVDCPPYLADAEMAREHRDKLLQRNGERGLVYFFLEKRGLMTLVTEIPVVVTDKQGVEHCEHGLNVMASAKNLPDALRALADKLNGLRQHIGVREVPSDSEVLIDAAS